MKRLILLTIWFTMWSLFATSCVMEPEKEYVYKDRLVYVESITGDVPLQYSYTEMFEIYSAWKQKQGMLLWIIAYNLSDEDWYGYPEIRIYTTDEPMNIDDSLNEYDLISRGIGVLATEISYNLIPQDSVEFIPANTYRQSLTFAEVNPDEIKQYYYVLWRFVKDSE